MADWDGVGCFDQVVIGPSPLACRIESPSRPPRLQRSGPRLETASLLARPGHLRPTGFGIRILLQPTNVVSAEYEVHLPQSTLGSLLSVYELKKNSDCDDI